MFVFQFEGGISVSKLPLQIEKNTSLKLIKHFTLTYEKQ